MSKQFNGLRWEITPQPLSRLDYIAALLMASCENHSDVCIEEHAEWSVAAAKVLIKFLDKEQNHE